MGYLHEGHLSLVRAARDLADHVVSSVYVNPGQFAPHEDFDTYPRAAERDLAALEAEGCSAVFTPVSLYGPSGLEGHKTWLEVSDLSAPLCGASRPHFFRGVATVVAKLFHIVEPDIAVFGDKDFQQRRIIERMVEDLDMAVRVVGAPIVREADGLAMSSRNVRLSAEDRARARVVPESLDLAERLIRTGARDAAEICQQMRELIEAAGGHVDYAALVDPVSLELQRTVAGSVRAAVAVQFGDVRLIDNRAIEPGAV
jgi:pantoate--beta-alanine ligase